MGLSSEEIYVAEVVAAKISGILSMIGSGLIIRDVILRWRRRKERQFLPIVSRIVLSMSIANLFNSCFVHFAGTWMVPKGNAKVLDETFPIPLATGNDLTCKVQAIFWSLFSLTGGCTNGTLATACKIFCVFTGQEKVWLASAQLTNLLGLFLLLLLGVWVYFSIISKIGFWSARRRKKTSLISGNGKFSFFGFLGCLVWLIVLFLRLDSDFMYTGIPGFVVVFWAKNHPTASGGMGCWRHWQA